LFSWHPFSVESVAWIAERKNVLSTFFFLLTVAAYGWYSRKPESRRMGVVVAAFVLALASKPMVVTLPFVLLLLDYWPLQRFENWTPHSSSFPVPQRRIRQLILEKVPLFVLSAIGCVLTVWTQKSGGSLRSLQSFPFSVRLENAVQSYGTYIWKTMWPANFAVLYPHPGTAISWWKPALALVVLCGLSAFALRERTSRPYLLVGWLWFLGTLVPVIGLVQVGGQAMADRYAYLPLIGLFLMVAWGATAIFDAQKWGPKPRRIAAVSLLGTLSILAYHQLSYWKTSRDLWSHALIVMNGNVDVEKELTNLLVMEQDTAEALPHLLRIAKLDPADPTTHGNLGASYEAQGRIQEATEEFETVVRLTDRGNLNPEDRWARVSALLNLGLTSTMLKDYPHAITEFQSANRSDTEFISKTAENIRSSLAEAPSEPAYVRLSLLLQAMGKDQEASTLLQNAISENPDYSNARAVMEFLSANKK
jgi:hypothetical protein